MSRYKRYERYKDSGVKWIGEIPEHWGVSKLKYLTYCLDGKRIPLSSEQRGEMQGDIPYWGANCIIDYVNDWLIDGEVVLLGEDGAPFFDKYKDVAFYSNGRIWPNNHVHVLRALQSINAKLLTYILNTVDYSNYIKGSTRDKLTQAEMKNIFIQLLPVREQKAIVNFLDQKTNKIDSLIADKEKLIELLQEKRQAIITEAVTKGLNTNARMKDSGIEWIGEIPEHWRIARLKFLKTSPFQYGANEPAEKDDPQLPRYIRITDINEKGELREDTFKSLSWESAQPYLLKDGDILFARSGATVGKTFLYNKELGYACYAGYLIRFKPDKNKVNSYYIYYYTLSKVYEEWIKQNIIQATIQNVSAEKYGNLQVPLPPLEEQKRIVKYLNGKIEEIDILVESIYVQIQKLKEYRQSLISEAVTGKIDVRDYVID